MKPAAAGARSCLLLHSHCCGAAAAAGAVWGPLDGAPHKRRHSAGQRQQAVAANERRTWLSKLKQLVGVQLPRKIEICAALWHTRREHPAGGAGPGAAWRLSGVRLRGWRGPRCCQPARQQAGVCFTDSRFFPAHPPKADVVLHLGAQAGQVELYRCQLSARRQRDDDRLCSPRRAGLHWRMAALETIQHRAKLEAQLEGAIGNPPPQDENSCWMAAAHGTLRGGGCSTRVCPLATGVYDLSQIPFTE